MAFCGDSFVNVRLKLVSV